jgi:hypothetical protein
MIALLDPVLHTPTYCRNSSGILFTSILTVAAKVTRPDLYPRLLAMCEEMSINCFRTGSRDIGYIQSVILLAFWRQAHDSTAWIMFGHAIRLGFAIGLHRFARRPLPSDELQARLILVRRHLSTRRGLHTDKLILSAVNRIGRERGYVRRSDAESVQVDMADVHDAILALWAELSGQSCLFGV